jgi:hypothetical protein
MYDPFAEWPALVRTGILDREHGVRCGPKYGHFFSVECHPPRSPERYIFKATEFGP